MRDSFVKRKLIAIHEILYEKKRLWDLHTKYRLSIMNSENTIKYIRKHRCSIARYGDGEFRLMMNVSNLNLAFQSQSPQLAERLLAVFRKSNPALLICIPRYFNSTKGLKDESKQFWLEWGKKNQNQINIVNLIRYNSTTKRKFGDSLISRPYMDMKTTALADRVFPQLKRLWEAEDILILEGELTRLGVENDLFSNAKSVKRILAPAINAFDVYDEIRQVVLDNYNGELLLIALGPTATVLAADFAEEGIWALDIGHIDIEYEWYLKGAKKKVAIAGKFTNEVEEGRYVSECENKEYKNQIIACVGLNKNM